MILNNPIFKPVQSRYIRQMYTIRKATIADAGTIRSLALEIWYDTYLSIVTKTQLDYMHGEIYSIEKLTRQIKNEEQIFLLVLEDGQIVAFAAYSPRAEDADIYKLHKLYCLPATQGKGYGKLLISEVAAAVVKAGKHTIDLNVNRHNKAKGFYEKMGFKVIYEEDVPVGPYFMNDYVMRKLL